MRRHMTLGGPASPSSALTLRIAHALGIVQAALALACSSASPAAELDAGGGADAGSSDAKQTPDARHTPDAPSGGDASDGGGGGDVTDASVSPTGDGKCPLSGDPVACDDGTAATACPLSAMIGATSSIHLRVSGSKFATSGACLYVQPSACPTTSGDVLQFSGGEGTDPGRTLHGIGQMSPYCFRLLSVAWDSAWEDDGMTTGGPAGMGGDMLAASGKPEALIAWVHAFLRSSSATPLCGTGGSAGSSELLYEVMHNGGEAMLDHVQLTEVTPFGRVDKGCDPESPQEGSQVVCSMLPSTTEPQYNGARGLVQSITHDPNCDVTGSPLSAAERASLRAMSLVPEGFSPMTLHKTSLSAFMCATKPNATQGQAVDVFGVNADLASAGTGKYSGLIGLDLSTKFYGCAAGAKCPPHVVCDPTCATEEFGRSMAEVVELAQDMQANCVLRH